MIKISLKIKNALVQPLEDALCELTRSNWGIEKVDDKSQPELFGYFDGVQSAKTEFDRLSVKFPELGREYEIENIDDRDWQNEYKKFLKPWQYENLHWIPIWMRSEIPVPAGHKALYFDAGLAFGTGDHPTTRLCAMSMLDYARQHDVSRKRLIDAGCGSGILALSAKLFGFQDVYGFDRDPEAVRVSRENAARNGIAPNAVKFSHAGIEKGLEGEKADIILANIISDVLYIYADNLIGAVRDGGWLVLSGILASENGKILKFFADKCSDRLLSCEPKILGEWSRLEIRMK